MMEGPRTAQCRSSPGGEPAVGHAPRPPARAPRNAPAAPQRQRAQAAATQAQRLCRGPSAAQAAPPLQGVPAAADPAQPSADSGGGAQQPQQQQPQDQEELVFAPEDFQLPPGQPSAIDREAAPSPADVFRCPGCTEPACQGPAGCARMQWRHSPAGYLRKILSSKVYDVAVETPLEEAPRLSEQTGNTVLLKREDMQSVFSFKLRGAFNKMASLTPEQRAAGVVCSSAGNHAQGVALAARTLGCRATICMPVVSPDIKVRAVKRLGGSVELVGETYTETQAHAQAKAAREGLVFIPPYDDPYIIAGQGTAGAEVLRQLSSAQRDSLAAVFVAVGGGGLAAGVAAYVKELMPHVAVFGVEPAGANCMAISLAHGRRCSLSKVDAFADGVAVKTVGAEPFRLCRQLLDGVLLVDNRAISGAIEAVFNDKRSILEPAGAVAVAGATQWLERSGLQGRTVVAITSGANMNFDRLRLVAELAAVGGRQEATFATSIPERPGAFREFVGVALADTRLQITEFKYRYSAAETAHVLWGASVTSPQAADELSARLNASGLPTRNASNIEAVQVHLRHLVGGRARSYMGALPHERIMQVDFPERPGALKAFLDVLAPAWNVTLFHYRKSGSRSTSILVGLQVPPGSEAQFAQAQAALGDEFAFSALPDDAREVFDMFVS